MESLKESVAYLHGLVEGVDLDVTTKEGRIITGIVETMGDIARSMEKLEARQADLEIYLDSIDEDLIDLEENVYQLDEGDFVEVECPECHDIVFLMLIFWRMRIPSRLLVPIVRLWFLSTMANTMQTTKRPAANAEVKALIKISFSNQLDEP